MPKIAMLNQEGAKVGEIELSEAIFASEINESVLHLVVRSQLAAKRQGTQSAKTRGEVRGGGRKIYRQKGTGQRTATMATARRSSPTAASCSRRSRATTS